MNADQILSALLQQEERLLLQQINNKSNNKDSKKIGKTFKITLSANTIKYFTKPSYFSKIQKITFFPADYNFQYAIDNNEWREVEDNTEVEEYTDFNTLSLKSSQSQTITIRIDGELIWLKTKSDQMTMT